MQHHTGHTTYCMTCFATRYWWLFVLQGLTGINTVDSANHCLGVLRYMRPRVYLS